MILTVKKEAGYRTHHMPAPLLIFSGELQVNGASTLISGDLQEYAA